MIPRLVIAGTRSGVGKTTIAIGLMAALTREGYSVQPFKVGPDYIDPGFHTLVTKNKSRNLDSYFLNEKGVKEVFLNAARKADISLIEGVMGLFDGKGRRGESSTAQLAKILKSPVILVIDGQKMAQSGAALAYGYKNFDPDLNVRGVILNNIAGEGHYQMLKVSIEEEVGLEVLGYLPRIRDLELPKRHLGLVPITESKDLSNFIDRLVDLVRKHIALDRLLVLAEEAPALLPEQKVIFNTTARYDVKLGVAYDQAFNFYYQTNLDILEKMGARLEYFSPIKDRRLPDVDGLYIGGGFPESFLAELAANESMKRSIFQEVESGIPAYAECGGLMYLTREIRDFTGNVFPMVGIIPGRIVMTESLQAMGYVRVKAIRDNLLLKIGEETMGHEFHYSKLVDIGGDKHCYQLFGGRGENGRYEGYAGKNLLASYVHLHFGSNLQLAERLLQACQARKRLKRKK